MTREEAIFELENNGYVDGPDRFLEAYSMAIKALKKVGKRGKEVKRWKRKYVELKKQSSSVSTIKRGVE